MSKTCYLNLSRPLQPFQKSISIFKASCSVLSKVHSSIFMGLIILYIVNIFKAKLKDHFGNMKKLRKGLPYPNVF